MGMGRRVAGLLAAVLALAGILAASAAGGAAAATRAAALPVKPSDSQVFTAATLREGGSLRVQGEGVAIVLPAPVVRALPLHEGSQLTVRLALTQGCRVHIRLLLDGEVLPRLPGTLVEVALPQGAKPLDSFTCAAEEGGRPGRPRPAPDGSVLRFVVHTPGVYALGWAPARLPAAPPPRPAAEVRPPPEAAPALPGAGLLALLTLPAALASGAAALVCMKLNDRRGCA